MRSRYSAYVMGEIEYIYKTYAPSSRAEQSIQSIKDWADSVSFINLEIVEASKVTDVDSYGFVEFVASYIDSDQLCKLHERSRFVLNNHQWFYIDGQIIPHPTKSIGRNESCPCGSGKKFKRCHS